MFLRVRVTRLRLALWLLPCPRGLAAVWGPGGAAELCLVMVIFIIQISLLL
jgi:hypothetical protein